MRADSGEQVDFFRVDGGAAANDLLMEFQADILGVDLHRPAILETTALGSALLAGLAVGIWDNLEDIRKHCSVDKSFSPQADPAEVQAHLARWREAVSKA